MSAKSRSLPPAAVTRSTLSGQSDARLLELAREGSEPAFEAIVLRYRRRLVRHCERLVGPPDAEEPAQEALVKAYAALRRGDAVRQLAPWLHAIAHNAALNYLHARASCPARADIDLDRCAVTDGLTEHRQELSEVLAAVRSLPDRQRAAMVMRELEGLSYDEISARLGGGRGSVRQLLSRARASVRARLAALVPFEPIVQWALGSTNSAGMSGGATLSSACMVGAKLCATALVPATIAVASVAPLPDRAIATDVRPGKTATELHVTRDKLTPSSALGMAATRAQLMRPSRTATANTKKVAVPIRSATAAPRVRSRAAAGGNATTNKVAAVPTAAVSSPRAHGQGQGRPPDGPARALDQTAGTPLIASHPVAPSQGTEEATDQPPATVEQANAAPSTAVGRLTSQTYAGGARAPDPGQLGCRIVGS